MIISPPSCFLSDINNILLFFFKSAIGYGGGESRKISQIWQKKFTSEKEYRWQSLWLKAQRQSTCAVYARKTILCIKKVNSRYT